MNLLLLCCVCKVIDQHRDIHHHTVVIVMKYEMLCNYIINLNVENALAAC